MTAKRKSAKRAVKRAAKRRPATRKPVKRAAKRRPATRKPVKRAAKRKPAARKAKQTAGAPRRGSKRPARPAKAAAKPAKAPSTALPVPVSAFALELVQVTPLRYEAAAALGRLETVELRVGTSEEGARVETLVFAPSGSGVQSSGTFVHRGQWNGARLLTEKGHLLDVDGSCFCRDCEAAGGYTVDDDE